MYKNILIATDGSKLSGKAIDHGVALARRLGAKATFVTVRAPFHGVDGEPETVVNMPEEYMDFVHSYLSEETDKRLAEAKSVADAAGVGCDAVCAENDHPYRGIIDTASRRGCDLIVMASHGRRGVSALVPGSETVKVLTHSSIPVLACR